MELATAAARAHALSEEVGRLRDDLLKAQDRADRAVDAALVQHGSGPITPQKEEKPAPPMFDDDPDELAAMMKRYKDDPVQTLLELGRGDG